MNILNNKIINISVGNNVITHRNIFFNIKNQKVILIMYKQEMMQLICDSCHTKYELNKNSYQSRCRRKSPNLCPICMTKYKSKMNKIRKQNEWNNKTPIEREEHRKATSKGMANMSEEAKKKRSELLSIATTNYLSNLDTTEKNRRIKKAKETIANTDIQILQDRHKRQIEGAKLAYKNKSDDEKIKQISELLKNRDNYYANRNEEEINRISKLLSSIKKEYYEQLSKEERLLQIKPLIDYIKNETIDQKDDRLKKSGIKQKIIWDNKTDEKREYDIARLHDGRDNYYKNETYEIFVEKVLRNAIRYNIAGENRTKYIITYHIDEMRYNTEREFLRLLVNNNIDFIFQFYSTIIHPKFHELFPNNPITGANYVSPFHRWDFMIKTKQTNIFIDIDGSIHNLKYNSPISKGRKFDDSQRLYQTDELPAYIVKCYNDRLNLDNIVINLYSNEELTVNDLFYIINDYNK